MLELKHNKTYKIAFDNNCCSLSCQGLKYLSTGYYCIIFEKLLTEDFLNRDEIRIIRCKECRKTFGGDYE